MKNFLLGLLSLFLIVSFFFLPLGLFLFKKWLDLETIDIKK